MKKLVYNRAKQWAALPVFDDETRLEIQRIIDSADMNELTDRFYRQLEFGTGGLRGVLGAGTNRMNIYTVRIASYGLARYLLSLYKDMGAAVCIAFDSRHNSELFARETARVFAASGIKSYLFDALRPVPELSFCVRYKRAAAGVCITASHNPPEYNGYKVFFGDGGQVVPPHDLNIITEVNNITDISGIPVASFEAALESGLIEIVGHEIDEAYLSEIMGQSVHPVNQAIGSITIVYTPLHGTGYRLIPEILKRKGFPHSSICLVEEQLRPDGNFPTVQVPNPEERDTFTIALQYAARTDADIALATDPDCDRIGVAVKDNNAKHVLLTGNQMGALLTDYILTGLSEAGKLQSSNSAVVKTIVTTGLINDICDAYSVECVELLTGFKYIGHWIKNNPGRDFVFGAEESYGYLRGIYARDKDAVLAASLICEMASYYKSRGSSIYERLQQIYTKYGYYCESLVSTTMKGQEGQKKIISIMNSLKTAPQKLLGSLKIQEVKDYKDGIAGLPRSNVLSFVFHDGSKVVVRPSGTEPKIKCYFMVKGASQEAAEKRNKELQEAFKLI
ncbi:phospho-sugar mutase [Candidatus Magnetominusculus xianensis]|uniref:Phosphoglucomutase n=1 Tax=Candidatus Magnetominusculus xianensis TaxID=1748249 RepID=A0ABR5SED4_9BACT|nr:phospho-sugar mutase [Candidatus Magnetominusculus xianensis]KWT79691.1 phosphoglucomutase [Candidatus Magnetominusculus xianensis]MBF0404769.1 phospho-sugar mutase [Nitrospirota bacterium]